MRIELGIFATQCHCQIEAEAVDVHFLHPVPQRIEHHAHHLRMTNIQGVACTGEVLILSEIGWIQLVVFAVIQSTPGENRPQLATFCGVVVNHIENDFDSGSVERFHHIPELVDLGTWLLPRRIARCRCEEPERAVPPVVGFALIGEEFVIHKRMDGQKLHRGHTEPLEVSDHGRVRHSGVGATNLFGHIRMFLRESLDMNFVDHRLRPKRIRAGIISPVVAIFENQRFRHRSVVGFLAHHQVIAWGVGVHGIAPNRFAYNRLGIRIEEKLVGVVAESVFRLPRTMCPNPVANTRTNLRYEPVPNALGSLGEGIGLNRFVTGIVEQAYLYRGRSGRVHRKICPLRGDSCTEGTRGAWTNLLQFGR